MIKKHLKTNLLKKCLVYTRNYITAKVQRTIFNHWPSPERTTRGTGSLEITSDKNTPIEGIYVYDNLSLKYILHSVKI